MGRKTWTPVFPKFVQANELKHLKRQKRPQMCLWMAFRILMASLFSVAWGLPWRCGLFVHVFTKRGSKFSWFTFTSRYSFHHVAWHGSQIFVCPCTCVFVCCVTDCVQSLELDIRLKKRKKGDFNPQSCLNRCLNWCHMQIHTLSVD